MSDELTKEDVARLPLRALMALASRCARRRRDSFDLPGDTPDRAKHMAALDNAAQLAANYAAGAVIRERDALDAAGAVTDAIKVTPRYMFKVPATMAQMAVLALHSILIGEPGIAVNRAMICIQEVREHAAAARADYQKLVSMKLGGHPDQGRPVGPNDLGPLWPDGTIAE